MPFRAGAASCTINPEIGAWVQGATVHERATSIRDPLEANALYLTDGGETVLFASGDVVCIEPHTVRSICEAMSEAAGIPSDNVIVACTHTHTGPSLFPSNPAKPLDEEYIAKLHDWLAALARDAVAAARPARVRWGIGEAKIGTNRRCCWADGTHTMHGDPSRDDFTGFEGPDDPQHLAMFIEGADGALVAVLHHNTAHATSFYGRNFFSADFPGEARRIIRDVVGEVPVLFLNGAIGDICIEDLRLPKPLWPSQEQKMKRNAHLLAGETLRLMQQQGPVTDAPVLRHVCEELTVDVRVPSPDRAAWARETLKKFEAGEELTNWDKSTAYTTHLLQERFGDDPREALRIHVVRIDDVAIVTQPTELFCQFALDIKRRSPTPFTAVCTNTDGGNGYCPTMYAVLGGGYSGEAVYSARYAATAGYLIVDAAARLLHSLWQE